MNARRRPVAVEVRPAKAPDGTTMVLLQFEHGYLLVSPDGAFDLARRLEDVALEVENAHYAQPENQEPQGPARRRDHGDDQ